MIKNKKISLKEIFLGLQSRMASKLSLNRKILTHPVVKGDASELEWVDMLGSHLPKRYQVEKAFVIDWEGNISEQIDIVIFDRHYSPFLLRQNGATYVPAESVYAVIEVRSTLKKENIIYAAKKAASVRGLKRTSSPIVHAGGKIDKPKKPFKILAGILTIDGKITKNIEDTLIDLKGNRILDIGCVLDNQSFEIKQDKGTVIVKSEKDSSLIFFFLKLLSRLQSLGTVPAMDIEAYIDSISKKRT